MKTPRSIRSYKPDEMPAQELLEQIIEAGTYAPTGKGMQSPIIVAVTNKPLRDRLSRLNAEVLGTTSDPFYGAPVVLIVLADRSRPTYLYDGSLVMGNLMNAAHALGLGSCWIQGRLRKADADTTAEEYVRARLGFPENYKLQAILSLGMPAAKPAAYELDKLPMEKVHYEKF